MLTVIGNPVAGTGRGKKVADQLTAWLKEKNIPFKINYTECHGDGERLAREAAKEGADTVISVGGDGTSLEVARGLFGTNSALGIIPAGTGNDFIKSLHIPMNPKEALEYLLAHEPRPVDAGLVNGKLFLNACGFGFDVSVLDYADKAKKFVKGLLPYLFGVICAIFKYNAVPVKIELDDKLVFEGKPLVCAFANGGIYGGGIPIAPRAAVDDGLFDVLIMKDVPFHLKRIGYLAGLLKAKCLTFDISTLYRAKKIHISPKKLRVNVDGEIYDMETQDYIMQKDAILVHW